MQRIRRAAAVMVAAVVLCYAAAAARAEGVLDQVPSDALVVIKINRLEQTNQKAGKWTEALGLAQLSPDAANPLGALQNKLGVKEGIDNKGDLAIVFLDPSKLKGKGGNNASAKKADGDDAAAEEKEEGGGNGGDEAVLVLVPTTDYKAFSGGLPNAKTEGSITTFHAEEGGDKPAYSANWGKYAAISPSKALLQNKPQGGMKATGLSARELKDKDVVVYANLPAIKAVALPHLQKLRQQMKQQMQNGGADGAAGAGAAAEVEKDDSADAPPAPRATPAPRRAAPAGRPRSPGARANGGADVVAVVQPADSDKDADATQAQNRNSARRGGAKGAKGGAGNAAGNPQAAQAMGAMVDQYFAWAERFLTDGQAATFGISFGDNGLNTTAMAEFAPNSYMGNIAQGMKNTDQNLMAGLPDRKYFAFGGFTVTKSMGQLAADMMQPMIKMQAAQGAQGKGAGDPQALVDAVKQVMDNAKSMSLGYTVPTGALGADSIIQVVTVVTGNAKAIAEGERKLMANMGTMMQGMQLGAGQGAGAPQTSFDIQEGAKTVGGVKLDQYKFNMEFDAQNNPQAAQIQQMMSMIYGPNGMSGVMGPVNDNSFLVVQGGTDKLVADAVAAAKAGQDVLTKSAPVQAVRGDLPKQRVGEFYVALDQIISSAVKYAQGFGMPVKMQLPQGLPPIALTAASEGTAVRIDSHVPTPLVQSVVAGVMQAYMQMQGGGAGAPDGL
jgi:hypothetical protein